MKILISNLPKHKWWGHGTPIYKDNPAMKQGMIPNQELVEVEMYMLTQLFNRLPVEVIEVDFPNFLDQQNTKKGNMILSLSGIFLLVTKMEKPLFQNSAKKLGK